MENPKSQPSSFSKNTSSKPKKVYVKEVDTTETDKLEKRLKAK